MSKAQTLLDNYTQVKRDIDNHIAKHQDVFDAHQQIVLRLIDAENALRDEVAATKEPVANSAFQVKLVPQDAEVCDFSKLDELIATATIPNIRNLIVYKQERPPRIVISQIR